MNLSIYIYLSRYKLLQSICDGAKIYAEALDHRIPKDDDDLLKDFGFTKKVFTHLFFYLLLSHHHAVFIMINIF